MEVAHSHRIKLVHQQILQPLQIAQRNDRGKKETIIVVMEINQMDQNRLKLIERKCFLHLPHLITALSVVHIAFTPAVDLPRPVL
jgi:hypothetical protein